MSSRVFCSILIISQAQSLPCFFCAPTMCRQGCGSLLLTPSAGMLGMLGRPAGSSCSQPCLAALFLLIKYASPPLKQKGFPSFL